MIDPDPKSPRAGSTVRRTQMVTLEEVSEGRPTATDLSPAQIAGLVAERMEVVAALRSLCTEYGDNDWPDDLHLADVIEKHLARHLEASGSGR